MCWGGPSPVSGHESRQTPFVTLAGRTLAGPVEEQKVCESREVPALDPPPAALPQPSAVGKVPSIT